MQELDRSYILGNQDDELNRLGFQHRMWSTQALDLWKRAGIRAGASVLDFGCGPGFTTFDIGKMVASNGSVMGVDISRKYVDYGVETASRLAMSWLEFRHVDMENADLGEHEFDFIYLRWVLSWIDDAEGVLDHLLKHLKPGGKILFQEYIDWGSFNIIPEIKEVRTVVEACRESWRQMPSEIDVGNKLPEMLSERGLHIEHMAPLERLARPADELWKWPTGFMRIYGERLIEMNLLTRNELDDYLKVLPKWENNPAACIVTPMMLEITAQKPIQSA